MRSSSYTLAFLLLVPAVAMAQLQAGTVELSFSGTLGSMSRETEVTYGGSTRTSEAEPTDYLSLALRSGVFVYRGLSIEPEFIWTAIEGDPPAFSLSGNLSYTHRQESTAVAPFVLVGYGIGNGIPIAQRLTGRSSSSMDIPVLNLGGGLKIFLGQSAAVRVEYRFQRFVQEETGYSVTARQTTQFHNLLVGFSVFLPTGGS